MNGELASAGRRWQLTFTRRLAHPPETVWRAITEPEHLAAWFPARMDGERAAGATLTFVFEGGEGPTTEGEMLVYDPPSTLEYRWGSETLRFELRPDSDADGVADGQGCLLTFVNTFDELGKAARDAAGWHACLDLLACDLDGARPPWDSLERWRQVHPGYVERFGPEASAIGPPETTKAPS
jgi:uncharacterized protein YndB with AHSA1/START domain